MQQCAFNAWIPNMYHVSSDTMYHVSDPNTKYLTVITLKLYSHNSYTKWLFPIQYYSNVLIVQLPSNCPPTSWYCESANWCSFCTGLLILWWSIQSSSTEYFTVQLLVQNWLWHFLFHLAELDYINTAYLNKIITNKIITCSIKLDN